MFFYKYIDKKIFKDSFDPNEYFTTIVILFVAVLGGISGFCDAVSNIKMFHLTLTPNESGLIYLTVYLWGLTVAESIIAAKKLLPALVRPFILAACFAVVFLAGLIAAFILVYIFVVAIFFSLIGILFSVASSNANKTYKLDDGTVLKHTGDDISGGLLGDSAISTHYAKDADGNEYRIDGGNATKL